VDAGDAGRVDRARRAALVIALAVTAILVAGVVYLHPGGSFQRRILAGGVQSPTPDWLPNQLHATYDFVSPKLGWSLVWESQVGSANPFWVFSTSDGARTWRQEFSGSCASEGAGPWVQFFDRSNGLVSECTPMEIFRTADGGAHWMQVSLPPYPGDLVTFRNPLDGWFLSSSLDPATLNASITHFLSTRDAGRSWTTLPLPPVPARTTYATNLFVKGGVFNVAFRGPLQGWLGLDGTRSPVVDSTSDGGLSWQPHALPFAGLQKSVSATVVLLPGAGVMVTTNDHFGPSVAFTSDDGGSSWQQLAPPPGSTEYSSYQFVDANHWWVMRNGTLFKSSDAGQAWSQAAQILDGWDYQPTIVDAAHAWAALAQTSGALGGGLAMTSDGGLHRNYVKVPQPKLT
jgi:hypothetical protein